LPAGAEKKIVEETVLAADGSKPPYRIHVLQIAPFQHLAQPGVLLLTFYNDRLLQTAFYPEQLEKYLANLQESGTQLRFGRELVNGDTIIWIGIDFDNKHYIGWADRRLREQQRRWLARYS
jgi:hypothetical protein